MIEQTIKWYTKEEKQPDNKSVVQCLVKPEPPDFPYNQDGVQEIYECYFDYDVDHKGFWIAENGFEYEYDMNDKVLMWTELKSPL